MSTNQKIGYARISTDNPNLAFQHDELIGAGCQLIFEDKTNDKNAGRNELNRCLTTLKAGDTLVIWRLDRLGRNLSDLVAIVTSLRERGIGIESLHDKIQTAGASGESALNVFAALAEFERNLVNERTTAGLKAARARGRLGGRKPKLKPKDVREIKAMLSDPNVLVSDVAKKFGVSRTTIYNHVGVIKPERDGANA